MATQSRDTHPEAERVQIELLRQKTIAQRFGIARMLSDTVMRLSRRAIREAHPGISEVELHILFVELNYGKQLAECVRKNMEEGGAQQLCQTS